MADLCDRDRERVEALAFRRLLSHLRDRTDVQNIDMMIQSGFCRNCLSRWYRESAEFCGFSVSDSAAREYVYGMPYEAWKRAYQQPVSEDRLHALAAIEEAARSERSD